MNEHMHSNTDSPAIPKRSPARRWLLAAALVAAVGATGLAGASYAGEGMHGGRHHAMDPAKAAKHIEMMIAKIAPDATAPQKARLTEIAKSAFADLQPVRAQLRDAHKRVHELLMQPVVDKVALEALRVEQVQRIDAVSKRLMTAVTDAADILTPEQRARFAEHVQKRMHH
ncbi:MAG: Spy/CpxP family protein refolding chaperone [Pseudomonadota bacterium]